MIVNYLRFSKTLVLTLCLMVMIDSFAADEVENKERYPSQSPYDYTQKEYEKKRGERTQFDKESKKKLLAVMDCMSNLAQTNFNRTISVSKKDETPEIGFFGYNRGTQSSFLIKNGRAYTYATPDIKAGTYKDIILEQDGIKYIKQYSYDGTYVVETPKRIETSKKFKRSEGDLVYKQISFSNPDFIQAYTTWLQENLRGIKEDSDNEKKERGEKGHLARTLKRIKMLNSCRNDLKEYPEIINIIDQSMIDLGIKENPVVELNNNQINTNRGSNRESSTSK